MPPSPFQYAIVRVVPRVERGECVNAGVVLFCRPRRFLAARVALDEARVLALAPDVDLEAVRGHLDAFARIAAGDPQAGPIAALPPSERFHWLVAPSSTVIQCSPVHTGLTDDPPGELERLVARLVRMSRLVWVGHATALIEVGGARLLTDPLLRSRLAHLRRHGPPPAPEACATSTPC